MLAGFRATGWTAAGSSTSSLQDLGDEAVSRVILSNISAHNLDGV